MKIAPTKPIKPVKPVCPCHCTPITSLPATISIPGVYCLTGNLASAQTTGNAITISANDVTLDLCGWTIDGQAAGTGTTANGIYSTAANVTIRNGTVRGFRQGIALAGLGGEVLGGTVQGIVADKNTSVGINVGGNSCLVQGNQVRNTGGSTTTANEEAIGIMAGGGRCLIENNLVSVLTAMGGSNERGIVLYQRDSTARGNVVNDYPRPTGGGFSIGIHGGTTNSAVINNIVTNFTYGVSFDGGSGTYSRNTVIGCDTPYSGGTAGSGND